MAQLPDDSRRAEDMAQDLPNCSGSASLVAAATRAAPSGLCINWWAAFLEAASASVDDEDGPRSLERAISAAFPFHAEPVPVDPVAATPQSSAEWAGRWSIDTVPGTKTAASLEPAALRTGSLSLSYSLRPLASFGANHSMSADLAERGGAALGDDPAAPPSSATVSSSDHLHPF